MTTTESAPIVVPDEQLQAEVAEQSAEREVREAEIAAYGIASQIGELEARRDKLVEKESFIRAVGDTALKRAEGTGLPEAPRPKNLWEKLALKRVTKKVETLDEAEKTKAFMEKRYGGKKLGGESLIDTLEAKHKAIKAAKELYKAGKIDKYSYWQAKTDAKNTISVKKESKRQKNSRTDVTDAESSLIKLAEKTINPTLLASPIRNKRHADIMTTQAELDALRGYNGPEAGTPPQWRHKEPEVTELETNDVQEAEQKPTPAPRMPRPKRPKTEELTEGPKTDEQAYEAAVTYTASIKNKAGTGHRMSDTAIVKRLTKSGFSEDQAKMAYLRMQEKGFIDPTHETGVGHLILMSSENILEKYQADKAEEQAIAAAEKAAAIAAQKEALEVRFSG